MPLIGNGEKKHQCDYTAAGMLIVLVEKYDASWYSVSDAFHLVISFRRKIFYEDRKKRRNNIEPRYCCRNMRIVANFLQIYIILCFFNFNNDKNIIHNLIKLKN